MSGDRVIQLCVAMHWASVYSFNNFQNPLYIAFISLFSISSLLNFSHTVIYSHTVVTHWIHIARESGLTFVRVSPSIKSTPSMNRLSYEWKSTRSFNYSSLCIPHSYTIYLLFNFFLLFFIHLLVIWDLFFIYFFDEWHL